MIGLDWPNERWRKIYSADGPDWLALSWTARALYAELWRRVGLTGILPLGRAGRRTLVGLTGGMPLDVLNAALDELLSINAVAEVPNGLELPEFVTAQNARQSVAARVRAHRNAQRESETQLALDVTPRYVDAVAVPVEEPEAPVEVPQSPPKRPKKAAKSPPAELPMDMTPEGQKVLEAICCDKMLLPIVRFPTDVALRLSDRNTYPGIDPVAEVKRAAAWLASNPTRKKQNGAAFLVRWFNRAQENYRGPTRGGHYVAVDERSRATRADEAQTYEQLNRKAAALYESSAK